MKLTILIRRVLPGACAAILCMSLVVLAARAQATPGTPMDEANRAFAEGRYGEASAAFETLVAKRGYSAPLLFNLGNAYLRDGKPVLAMLAYERAEILAPRDEGIHANLAVARSAAMAPDDSSAVGRVARTLPMDTWAWMAAGGFWITMAALAGGVLAKRYRPLLVTVAACGAITLGASSAALVVVRDDLDRGLVMATAPVLVSPFATAESDFALLAGCSVRLGPSRDGYVFVRDASGRSGWLERAQIEPLVPRVS